MAVDFLAGRVPCRHRCFLFQAPAAASKHRRLDSTGCSAPWLLGSLAWAGHGRGRPAVASGGRCFASAGGRIVAGRAAALCPALAPTAPEFGHGSLAFGVHARSPFFRDELERRSLAHSDRSGQRLDFGRLLRQFVRAGLWPWLLAKIILFGVAVAIAAVNLLRLKPRLVTEITRVQNAEPTAARLQFNVHMELALGMAIVIIVAILGILPPANLETTLFH